jgi:uncharacterized protein YutE (UPF0331/DUF86 family)
LVPDREVIGGRLALLEEYLQHLAPLAQLDVQAFAGEPRNYGAAERFLQLAIEALFDIGTHCIAALALPRPAKYADIVPARADASIIRLETAARLESLAGFRNLLVHEYARLDRRRVHEFLNTRLDDLRAFAADVAGYLRTLEQERGGRD